MKQYREQAIKVDSAHIDHFGILRAKAKIARIGVQEYYQDGKIIRELRLPEEVKASAISFSHQIVTLDHPSVFVDSGNAQHYSKGLSGEIAYKDGWLVGNVTVTHLDAVNAAQTTHKQFSNGYYTTLEGTAGEWVDELGVMGESGKSYQYDCIQRNIEGNHIALVKKARAGSRATFTDAEEEFTISHIEKTSNNMVKIVHSDRVYEIEGDDAPAVADIVSDYKTQLDEALKKAESNEMRADELAQLKKDKSELEGKIIGLEDSQKNQETDADVLASEIEARLKLWSQVQPHLDSKPDYSLSEIEIKKLYLTETSPELKGKIDSADENFINGIWLVKQPIIKESTSDRLKRMFRDSNTAPSQKTDLEAYEDARRDYLEMRKKGQKS
jgi:uncharacterized protein